MQLLSAIFCCCKDDPVEAMEQPKKTTFPQIVIQEPTPMIPRKESEIVEEVKVKDTKAENIASEVPATVAADPETGEEATETTDVVDSKPVKKSKGESIRKKSIPLLDQEHRMQTEDMVSAVIAESETNVPMGQTKNESTKVVTSSSAAVPSTSSSVASPAPPPSNPSLQTTEAGRKTSNVSTSSDWSWPSVQGKDHGDVNTIGGADGLNLGLPEGPSRRISTLAPAQVDSPLATKVDKFTMIPHPGK